MACSADRTVSRLADGRERGDTARRNLVIVEADDRNVRQPLREEGHMAANIALDMIKGAEPTTSVMHMQLIQRDSL